MNLNNINKNIIALEGYSLRIFKKWMKVNQDIYFVTNPNYLRNDFQQYLVENPKNSREHQWLVNNLNNNSLNELFANSYENTRRRRSIRHLWNNMLVNVLTFFVNNEDNKIRTPGWASFYGQQGIDYYNTNSRFKHYEIIKNIRENLKNKWSSTNTCYILSKFKSNEETLIQDEADNEKDGFKYTCDSQEILDYFQRERDKYSGIVDSYDNLITRLEEI